MKKALPFLLLILLVVFSFLYISSRDVISRQKKTEPLDKTITPFLTPQQTPIVSPELTPVVSIKTNAFVKKVVDGDTITVEINGVTEVIRLIGINTPESVDPRRSVECFGKEASLYAKTLLDQKHVLLVEDVSQANRDKYNRLLRYVYLDNGAFVNKRLIEEGYAYEYTYGTPYQFQSAFKVSEKQALSEQKGLWNPAVCDSKSTGTDSSASFDFVDKDCSDFSSQEEAQDFFIKGGGSESDPHRLDVDKDGIVCESL